MLLKNYLYSMAAQGAVFYGNRRNSEVGELRNKFALWSIDVEI
jgi:hypothetical protein